MPPRTKYSDICALFASKDCRLLTTEAEYNENHMTKQDKYRYVARCGHESEVYCTNFINNSGIDCPKCASSKALEKTIKSSKNKVGNKEILKRFISMIEANFMHKLTVDEYRVSNIFIRPKDSTCCNWLRVLVRCSSGKEHIQFTHNNDIPSYVLVGMATNRTWIFPSFDMIAKCIQIKNEWKNKYEKYEVERGNIDAMLNKYYNKCELVEDDDKVQYHPHENHLLSLGFHPMEFEEIVKRFAEKGCTVMTTKDEFIENKMHTKSIFTVRMTCSHDDKISLSCFQKRKHCICQQCIYKEVKSKSYDEVNQVTGGNLNEAVSFQHVENLINMYFNVVKTHEGCRSDMAIRPKDVYEDAWMCIQLKSAKIDADDTIYQYGFKKIGKYPNMIVLCTLLPMKRMWLFDGNDLLGKSGISIGKNTSKYKPNEITRDKLVDALQNKYKTYVKYKLSDLNIPTYKTQQKEHANRLLRERLLDDQFVLTYPNIDGSKYDIKINNHKVQDKCARKASNANSYYASFGTTKVKSTYKKGDNAFYWINMPDGNFYIIPEHAILDQNGRIKERITLNHVYSEYYFQQNDSKLIEKLKEIFITTDVAASHGY